MVKNESGVTLIELMVSIAIIGVVISALYLSYFSSVSIFSFNRTQTEFHRDQRLISENIARYIRSADEIDYSYNPGGLAVDGLLIKYVEMDGTDKKIFFGVDNNDYFIVDKDPDNSGGERVISQNKISTDNTIFNYSNGVLEITVTLVNNNGKEYTFVESYNPRISNVNVTS